MQKNSPRRRILSTGFLIATAAVLSGAALGIGGYTFIYAEGASYMTNDPRACANCHVMNSQFDAWTKSSHKNVAVCNDCHAPHDFFGKYTTKAINGFNHSLAFTTGRFHEPIQITPRNRAITEAACRSCHAEMVQVIDPAGVGHGALECLRCHSDVGHPN